MCRVLNVRNMLQSLCIDLIVNSKSLGLKYLDYNTFYNSDRLQRVQRGVRKYRSISKKCIVSS